LRVLNPNAAGIDVHADMHIRVMDPGLRPATSFRLMVGRARTVR
jgi:hypothetical protein